MSRLEEIRNEYAKSKGFSCWNALYTAGGYEYNNNAIKAISELYAKECAKASIELSKENTSWFINSDDCGYIPSEDYHNILEMIENPNNIVLL